MSTLLVEKIAQNSGKIFVYFYAKFCLTNCQRYGIMRNPARFCELAGRNVPAKEKGEGSALSNATSMQFSVNPTH